MQPRHRPLHPILRLRQGAALLWLLLALVWAPTLGRLHQSVHGGQGAHPHAAHAAAPSGGASQFLLPLLADHTPVDCLLLDQLALGDALHSAPSALPTLVPAQASPVQHAGRSTAPHVALFQARGPPTA